MATCQCFVQVQKITSSSSNSNLQPFQLPALNHFLLTWRVSNLVNNLQGSMLRHWLLHFCQFFNSLAQKEAAIEFSQPKRAAAEEKDDRNVSGEDAEIVMRKLGLFCSQRGGEIEESITADKLSELFNDCEPSLGELKEAFNIFDRNGDGFIDAVELQRVLNALGLKEVAELQSCEKMIRNFDENKDGRIDFKEFVRLMEITLC